MTPPSIKLDPLNVLGLLVQGKAKKNILPKWLPDIIVHIGFYISGFYKLINTAVRYEILETINNEYY